MYQRIRPSLKISANALVQTIQKKTRQRSQV